MDTSDPLITFNDQGLCNLCSDFLENRQQVIKITDNNDSLNATDHGKTGLPQRGGMGKGKVTLMGQNNFSRGDSIGDISGLVKITNTGSIPVTVTCN